MSHFTPQVPGGPGGGGGGVGAAAAGGEDEVAAEEARCGQAWIAGDSGWTMSSALLAPTLLTPFKHIHSTRLQSGLARCLAWPYP